MGGVLILRHVYRSRPQPELAPCHPAARKLSRGRKVRKRTLCNLSDWPAAHIEGLRGVLRGGTVIPAGREAFTVIRTLPHGHVAAALGTARRIGLDRILGPDGNRCRDLVLALLVGRILEPASKLAAARALSPATAASSLGAGLDLGEVDEDELYTALDWLLERQAAIETALAKRHLTNGTLVLYDVSSSYMEGRCCPLAKRGYSRDGRRGTLQIIYGLLCAADGCPVAIEVFDGNTADPMTLATQVEKLKQRFHLDHVVLVGDRGMITQARITDDIKAAGLDWITALRARAMPPVAWSARRSSAPGEVRVGPVDLGLPRGDRLGAKTGADAGQFGLRHAQRRLACLLPGEQLGVVDAQQRRAPRYSLRPRDDDLPTRPSTRAARSKVRDWDLALHHQGFASAQIPDREADHHDEQNEDDDRRRRWCTTP